MFPLIETIRLENGRFNNLEFHQRRMQVAIKDLYAVDKKIDLETILAETHKPLHGLYKCRLSYDKSANMAEFTPYVARPVNRLKLAFDDTISYPHKFSNRDALEVLFGRRGGCDDVLIIKNGMVTDTTYANIALRRGREWFTPSTCLLPGTMRQNLLDRKVVSEVEIGVKEIASFESFKIINAMLMFDAMEVSIKNILN